MILVNIVGAPFLFYSSSYFLASSGLLVAFSKMFFSQEAENGMIVPIIFNFNFNFYFYLKSLKIP